MEILTLWGIQAVIIAVATSAVLNISPFLPWLRDIEASRIEARWTGYVGLFLGCLLWVALNPDEGAWSALVACGVIQVVTLIPNTLVHWRAESLGGGRNGRLPPVIVLSRDECEDLIAHLTNDHGRDLSIALLGIEQAVLKARRVRELAPDQLGAQVWFQGIREPLETASNLVAETRDEFVKTYKKALSYRDAIDELCKLHRRGLITIRAK